MGGGGDDTVDSLFDLRGRLGVAAGKSLIYGSLGYSAADLTINGTNSASLSGVSYGVGVDFALGGTMFLGLDYTRRTVDGQTDTGTFDLDSDIDTLSLRAGINF